MFIIIKLLRNIVKILQTDISPNQIAYGFAFGLFLGLVPGLLMKTLFFIIIMFLRVNVGASSVGGVIFGVLSFALDPLANKIGFLILNSSFLFSFWTYLYNLPIVPFTKFNNTVVMGNIFISIILFIPAVLAAKKFIPYYRTHYRDKVAKWKIMKVLTAGRISALIFE